MAQKDFLVFAGLLLTLMACHTNASPSDRAGESSGSCNQQVSGVIAVNLANNCCNNNASSGGQQGCCADAVNLDLCQFRITDILNGLGINVNVLDIAADILKALCGISNDSGDKGGVCNGKLNQASSCLLSNGALEKVLTLCELDVLSNIGILASLTDITDHFQDCVISQYDEKQTTCCSINESDEAKCVTCTNNICGTQLNTCKKSDVFSMTQSQGQAGCCNAACNSKSG